MNLGEKKELDEPTIPCKQEFTNDVDVSKIHVPQYDVDLTTTICDEQAKSDIYLPDEVQEDASKKMFKCPACEQLCTKRGNIRRHIRRFHGGNRDLLKQVSADYCVACLLCEQRFSHIIYLKAHLTKTHNVKFDEQEYFFHSSDEFLEWKSDLERRTNSIYIKQTGKVPMKNGISYSYFKCHRSGNYKPTIPPSHRKRKLKACGTVKMNNHCTSVMKLLHGMNGEVNVYFCATHYGHDSFKECKETMLKNSVVNSKYSKKSKIPLKKGIGNSIDPKYLHETVPSDHMVNIIVETSLQDNNTVKSPDVEDDSNSVINANITPDYPCSSPNSSVEDDSNSAINAHTTSDYSCSSPNSSIEDTKEEQSQPTAKRKLVSNLQQLICVIENCHSEEILDLVANDVGELVNKFTPLVTRNK